MVVGFHLSTVFCRGGIRSSVGFLCGAKLLQTTLSPLCSKQWRIQVSYHTHKVRANKTLLFIGNALVLCFFESLEVRVVVHTGQRPMNLNPSLYTFNPEPANPQPYLLFYIFRWLLEADPQLPHVGPAYDQSTTGYPLDLSDNQMPLHTEI